jgi:uncharacterized protein (DUF305 family)
MKNRSWVALAIAIVVGLGAGVAIGAAAWGGEDQSTSTPSDESASGTSHDSDMAAMDGGQSMTMASLDERTFLEQMVAHHSSAVEMAEMAVERAEHPEVRRLAQQIISSQEQEIGRMRAYYLETFGEELVPSTSGPHASMNMSALETATDDFDRVFLAMMIPHHASAITMADSVMMGNPGDEVMMLAEEIISAQAKEIGQMQQWREKWYPPLG